MDEHKEVITTDAVAPANLLRVRLLIQRSQQIAVAFSKFVQNRMDTLPDRGWNCDGVDLWELPEKGTYGLLLDRGTPAIKTPPLCDHTIAR